MIHINRNIVEKTLICLSVVPGDGFVCIYKMFSKYAVLSKSCYISDTKCKCVMKMTDNAFAR